MMKKHCISSTLKHIALSGLVLGSVLSCVAAHADDAKLSHGIQTWTRTTRELERQPRTEVSAPSNTQINLEGIDASDPRFMRAELMRQKLANRMQAPKKQKRTFSGGGGGSYTPIPPGFADTMGEPLNTTSDVGTQFTGTTLSASLRPWRVPADTMGAIGTEQYIICDNNIIKSFKIDRDKETAEPDDVLDLDIIQFFSQPGGDPQIRFDFHSKRWFISYLTAEGSGISVINNVVLAVSDSDVITKCTKWKFVRFNTDETRAPGDTSSIQDGFIDFPQLGFDKDAVYVTGNIFPDFFFESGFFVESGVWVIQKESLLNCGVPNIVYFTTGRVDFPPPTFETFGFGPFAGQPINNFDTNSNFGYVIGNSGVVDDPLTQPGFNSKLIMYRILNPGSLTPSLSDPIVITVPVFDNFGGFELFHGVPHKGDLLGPLAAVTTLMPGVYVRDGKLYAAHGDALPVDSSGTTQSFGSNDRFAVRWYEIDLKGNDCHEKADTQPKVLQIGTIWDPNPNTPTPNSYSYPSLVPNKKGDLVVSCQISGEDHFIDAVTFRRKKNDPLCAIGPEKPLTFSDSSYNVQPARLQRWDDYTFTSLDPVNKTDSWSIIGFVNQTDDYGLTIAQLKPKS